MDIVKFFRRIVRKTDGQIVELENQVQAKEILNWGDLPERAIDLLGMAILVVNTDGKAVRTTVGDLLDWMQASIQSDVTIHTPYLNNSGDWMVYDTSTGTYVNSGINGSGIKGDPGYPGTKEQFEALLAASVSVAVAQAVADAVHTEVASTMSDYSTTEEMTQAISSAITQALGGYVTTGALTTALGEYATSQQVNDAIGNIETLLASL